MNTLLPLSLYIHIPWCVRKCPYCDFNSHAIKDEPIPEAAYVEALLQDLEQDLPLVWGKRVSTIFFGGGTPSVFSPESIEKILQGVRARIPVLPNAEITLEANPGTVEQNKFSAFKAAGINRLSIGVQSFNPKHLKVLGRIHDDKEAQQAILAAKAAGFDNFNLDLMFALPQQTIDEALTDLDTAIRFAPNHLSWYHLTLEPNTLFFIKPPKLPNEAIQNEIFTKGKAFLAEHGYQQYEVSAYSRQGQHPCAHNVNYWEFGDYLGIGAGAHSKITLPNEGSIIRLAKHRHPKAYLKNSDKIDTRRTLTPSDRILEFMMNALRLNQGVPLQLFEERTGLSRTQLAPMLSKAKAKGLLTEDPNQLRASHLGQQFLDDLVGYFLT